MKIRNLVLLFASLLVLSCGDGGSGIVIIDARPRVDAPPGNCDLIAQDCPAGLKCTLVDSGTGVPATQLVSACVAVTGNVAANGECTRIAEDGAGWGNDTCADSWCSGVGVISPAAGGSRICRAYCTNNFDCGANEACLALYPDPAGVSDTTNQPTGFCMATCDLFSTTCTDQDPGLDCHIVFQDLGMVAFGACWPTGPTPAGGDCTGVECVAGHFCYDADAAVDPPPTCTQMCDTTGNNDCPPAETCTPFGGDVINGGGLCL